ncbi:GDP-mannose 4,6-dehydratase [Cellulomonas pakistanensis]|uniref:GDP-mannose 4,6-dehydratase n=1 Tax=Cellulomonas pakistanensis TaxID=992287 RepID=A0A919PBV2_9CELL|nr:GDP-mannose 4,6-dehydratase [Cellulomonas pakistanensis]GIG36079.1 GDP-mannose 4,6-dehydratase [Cellulomonas pakistanensis]
MTTTFVTGITGQDGTYLVERLLDEGTEVHGLVRPGDGGQSALRARHPGVVLHEGDLGDPDRLAAIVADVAPDEVVNLAGISSVALSWQEPVLTARLSGLAVAVLLEAAHEVQESAGRPVRFLQASSSEIFGQPESEPQDERTPVRPVSPYGSAKAFAHHQVGVYRGRGLHAATAILFNHESPLRPTTFVTRKITAAAAAIGRTGTGTIALGNLDARRDWGWAPDYVDAMLRALRHGVPDDFVVATGRTRSVRDFAEAALRRAGVGDDWERFVEVDPRFFRPADAAVMVGDPSKAERELGWRRTVEFEEVVGRMVDHDLELAERGAGA